MWGADADILTKRNHWELWCVHIASINIILDSNGLSDPAAFFSVIFFASGASFVLGLIYLWCLFATAPRVVNLYHMLFGHISGHLSLVNGSEYPTYSMR